MSTNITVRCATRTGAWTVSIAKGIARKLKSAGSVARRYQLLDGFLLTGSKLNKLFSAQVIDPPGFLYFAGFNDFHNSLSVSSQTAASVGSRDDFSGLGASGAYNVKGGEGSETAYMLLPFTAPPSDIYSSTLVNLAPIQQAGRLLSVAYLNTPLLASSGDGSFDATDDMGCFTFDTIAAVGGGALAPYVCGVGVSFNDAGFPSFGSISKEYLAQQGFWVRETDLPDGWKLRPRRLVPHTNYAPYNDPYRSRRGPRIVQPGLSHAVHPRRDAAGVDRYCVAGRVFRQNLGLWYEHEPGATYRPQYYDRNGEQGLLIAVGEYDREDYLPESPPARASIKAMQIVTPADLPIADLHPLPVFLSKLGAYGKPDVTNFGAFYTPHVSRITEGYAVFSVYETLRNENDPLDADPDENLSGYAVSLVTSISGGDSYTLLADWDYGPGGSPIDTSNGDSFVYPWIVGSCHWLQVAEDGEKTYTACCLVWEHVYSRKTDPAAVGNRGIGGRLVLYKTDVGMPTRTVLSTDNAPLFAPSMDKSPGVPFAVHDDTGAKFPGSSHGPARIEPFSEVQYLGAGRMVAAAIASPYPATGSDKVSQAEHAIYCLSINLDTGEVVRGGAIAMRTTSYRKCMISVVQPVIAAEGDAPERPATLLATVVDHINFNIGAGGKVYLSTDSGETWREYVSDAGAQGGAHYIGNKLWWFDNTMPLTTGGSQ